MSAPLRRLLIIGETEAEARAFVGMRPDHPPGEPTAPDRASLLVPDDLWPTGEQMNTSFLAAVGWPARAEGQPPIDALIVTAAALRAYGATVDDVRAWSAGLLSPDGGWLYVQPARTHCAVSLYDATCRVDPIDP